MVQCWHHPCVQLTCPCSPPLGFCSTDPFAELPRPPNSKTPEFFLSSNACTTGCSSCVKSRIFLLILGVIFLLILGVQTKCSFCNFCNPRLGWMGCSKYPYMPCVSSLWAVVANPYCCSFMSSNKLVLTIFTWWFQKTHSNRCLPLPASSSHVSFLSITISVLAPSKSNLFRHFLLQ